MARSTASNPPAAGAKPPPPPPARREVPEGFAEIAHDDATASFTFAGETFASGEDGRLFVPVAAVADAGSHGFLLISNAD